VEHPADLPVDLSAKNQDRSWLSTNTVVDRVGSGHRSGLLCRSRFRLLAVLALEPLNATRGIDQLLLSRKEGMATGADFDLNLLLGRSGDPLGTTSTGYLTFNVVGMNILFHRLFSSAR